MTLIKSISGIRGTIGGRLADNLTPLDAVKFASAYGIWLKNQHPSKRCKVVIGRDARLSGAMMLQLVSATLTGLGIDVIDLGLSTTPTVELTVPETGAQGGIILTASHNPKEWNALKLLNERGEFLDAQAGAEILKTVEKEDFTYVQVDDLGRVEMRTHTIEQHIQSVMKLPLVKPETVRKAGFKVVVDAVNSTGGLAIPALLRKMGVEVVEMYCEPTGHFPHNPEPLKEHLTEIAQRVVKENADLGIVVDPDVDRLAFICNDGEMFGEEYTLVACADYVLQHTPGNTVSNLSSSRALRDITLKHGGQYFAAAVGEVNVVQKMKEVKAVIGGEGNGGIIYPDSHYGRDALVGVGLFLTHLAQTGVSSRALRDSLPAYFMAKNKIALTPEINVDGVLNALFNKFKNENCTTIDGLKIDFTDSWVHLRKSNTEPIIRIYTEATSQKKAEDLADRFLNEIKKFV